MKAKNYKVLLDNYNKLKPSKKKYLYGFGIFEFLKSAAKTSKKAYDIGSKVYKALSSDAAKKAYQIAYNEYRKNYCDGKARPLEFGEMHLPCHNYSGPGTVMSAKNYNYPPYNNIDNCSRTHDIAYGKIQKMIANPTQKAELVKKADEQAIQCYDRYPNESGYQAARAGIKSKINIEDLYSQLKGEPTVFYGAVPKADKKNNIYKI